MGTYTTNKELFMPTVGEQGWGTLVNGNFETIDTYLKPISLSGSTYTFTGNQTGGSINATSITNSGTLTNTGKITANGGIDGNLTGLLFVKGTVETAGDVVYATAAAQSAPAVYNGGSVTVNPYVVSFPDVYEIVPGVAYCRKSDVITTEYHTRTVTITNSQKNGYDVTIGYGSPSTSWTTIKIPYGATRTLQWVIGETYSYSSYIGVSGMPNSTDYTIKIAATSLYVKFARP